MVIAKGKLGFTCSAWEMVHYLYFLLQRSPKEGRRPLCCCPRNLSFFSRNFKVNTPLIHGSKLREGHRAYSLLLL